MMFRSSMRDRTLMVRIVAPLLCAGTFLLATEAGAQAGVRGAVLDSLGGGIPGAQITVQGSSASAVTDASGAFRIQRLPAGTVVLNVRRLGYRPAVRTVEHAGAAESVLEIRLTAVPEVLPTVEVRRRPEASDARLAGYNARREKRVGHFVTRDQIERHDSPRFADVLRGVPGLVVKPLRGSGGGRTVSIRGNCSPLVFLDGFPAASGALDLD